MRRREGHWDALLLPPWAPPLPLLSGVIRDYRAWPGLLQPVMRLRSSTTDGRVVKRDQGAPCVAGGKRPGIPGRVACLLNPEVAGSPYCGRDWRRPHR
jgi:hypothetical protein